MCHALAMTKALEAQFDHLIVQDEVEFVGDAQQPFVSLLTLDSGAQYGLTRSGEELVWAVKSDAELTAFSSSTAKRFVELIEHNRRDLDDRIEAAAADKGLPPIETALSLPVFELARILLRGPSHHFLFATMRWLQPTDLRELRDELKKIAENEELPQPMRDLAQRLVVH